MLIDGQDIFKNIEPVQFPKDEIRNEKDRIVRGWMSVEVKDKQGEIVPIDDLKRSLNIWMKRGAPMMDNHSNRHIGHGLNWSEAEHPETGTPGIHIDYRIFDDYSTDDQVWGEIKSGKRKGLSMGGRALGKPERKTDAVTGESADALKDIETYEVSPVDDPANQFAMNEFVNLVAKSQNVNKEDIDKFKKEANLLFKDLQTGYAVKDISKPFAGFENFAECEQAQISDGKSEESAGRICGFLQARTEKEKQVRDPAAVCGNIWFNGTEEQRGAFAGGTQGRSRTDKPPKDWFDDCTATVGKAKSVEKFMLSPDEPGSPTIKSGKAQKGLYGGEQKNKTGNNMEGKKDIGKQIAKQEDMQPPSVDEQIPAWAQALMDRIASLEEAVGVGKQEEKKPKETEEPDKKEDEEEKKPKEEEKQEEDKKPDKKEDEEKKKIDEENIDVKPPENPTESEEGKTVLPKAEAGETDEDAPPETDKVQLMEKAVRKEVSKTLESLGIDVAKKATTPRPASQSGKEVVKSNEPKEVAFDYVEKAREGKVDIAEMNRDLRKGVEVDRSQEIKEFLKEGE